MQQGENFILWIIDTEGVSMDQQKVKAVLQWPTPQTLTEVDIFKHPIPEAQFLVKLDASYTGVGAVLSQRSGERLKIHPVAFFSKTPK